MEPYFTERPMLLPIRSMGTGFFPSISANNPCSFGLNVITLEQKYEVLKEEVVRWVFIR